MRSWRRRPARKTCTSRQFPETQTCCMHLCVEQSASAVQAAPMAQFGEHADAPHLWSTQFADAQSPSDAQASPSEQVGLQAGATHTLPVQFNDARTRCRRRRARCSRRPGCTPAARTHCSRIPGRYSPRSRCNPGRWGTSESKWAEGRMFRFPFRFPCRFRRCCPSTHRSRGLPCWPRRYRARFPFRRWCPSRASA